ncbi:M48 family metalloprotease [Propioniciclava coleopterorum]|uniref:M48 family metalloprotease n=1 Tax=Propioniciclava coleopterorum TaxID=2714937 RepID=A0A6G7Y7X8_9ACTN|nr:M48 family metalloprotease [Propioniciclava coleopterorum]
MPVVRAWAPRLVLVAFPLFVVAVLAALVWLSFAASAATHLSIQPFLRWIVVPLVVVVAAAIWRSVRSGRPEPLEGPELTPQDHPALWAEVTQLARAAQTDPPARIVLTRENYASVTEAAGIKEMELGIPILGALTVTELRAVLGHELGHFVGGDTSEPAFLARTRQALHRIWRRRPGIPAGCSGPTSRSTSGLRPHPTGRPRRSPTRCRSGSRAGTPPSPPCRASCGPNTPTSSSASSGCPPASPRGCAAPWPAPSPTSSPPAS